MNDIIQYSGAILLLCGSFFVFTASVGLFRFPECITRIHAAGVADAFGVCLILFGVALLSLSWAVAVKLLLLALFLLITSPTACHALVQAAFETPAIKKRWQRLANKREQ